MSESSGFKSFAFAGAIFSLSVGFLDSIFTVLCRVSRFSSFKYTLEPLARFVFWALLLFLIVSLLLRFLVLFKLKIAFLPACFAATAFLGSMSLFLSIWILMQPESNFSKTFTLTIYFIISLIFAVLIYSFANRPPFSRRLISFLFALPFLLGELWIAAWMQVYGIRRSYNWRPAFFFLLIFVLPSLTTWFVMRSRSKRREQLVFLLLVVVMILNPAIIWSYRQIKERSGFQENAQTAMTPVILITIDTLRADELSSYGSRRVKTPQIDSVGADGLIFTNAFSTAPWTLPSLVSILTGSTPLVHQVTRPEELIPKSIPTIAERMRSAGYYTSAIVSNPYLVRSNLIRGFRDVQAFPKMRDSTFSIRRLRAILNSEPDEGIDSWTPEITEETVSWLHKNHRKNFFLWVHYLDPHLPYSPEPQYYSEKKSSKIKNPFRGLINVRNGSLVPNKIDKLAIRNLYEGEVRFVDHEFGKILSTLKKLGLYDRALIILSADHGEEFWEHGGYEHGHTLYNELLHVPLILKFPHSSLKGSVLEDVATSQIAPTIMNVCGISSRDKMFASSLISGNKINSTEEPIIATGMLYFEQKIAVISGNYKYIRNLTTNTEEIYDLSNDFDEKNSLTSDLADQLLTQRKILSEQKEQSEVFRQKYKISNKSETIDEETANQLRAIGYIK